MRIDRPSIRFNEPVRLPFAFRDCNDWTRYLTRHEFLKAFTPQDGTLDLRCKGFDGVLTFEFAGTTTGDKITGRGRFNAVCCFEEYFAITLRNVKMAKPDPEQPDPEKKTRVQSAGF